MKFIEENRKIWDERSENNDTWSIPVISEVVKLAREGIWSIVLTPTKPVPSNWFPEKLNEKKILCLASGGRQQGPILSATGAEVTVFDNCSTKGISLTAGSKPAVRLSCIYEIIYI